MSLWRKIFGNIRLSRQRKQECPEGFVPIEIDVAGSNYDGRGKHLQKCKVMQAVTLVREPTNEKDKNTIQVVCREKHKTGYVPRVIAEHLARYMDSEKRSLPAIITCLKSNISSSFNR